MYFTMIFNIFKCHFSSFGRSSRQSDWYVWKINVIFIDKINILEKKYNYNQNIKEYDMMVVTYATFTMTAGLSERATIIGLGRAKTRPEIWPAGYGFWVVRPGPYFWGPVVARGNILLARMARI